MPISIISYAEEPPARCGMSSAAGGFFSRRGVERVKGKALGIAVIGGTLLVLLLWSWDSEKVKYLAVGI